MLFAIGCSSTAADATPDATQTQDVSGPRPWCPTPAKLQVADSPDDYLPPVEVTLEEVLDGDTAYFKLASGVVERIRFMHINAEEVEHESSSPAQNAQATAFGAITKRHVYEVLSSAKTIAIAPHRHPNDPDKPESDAFGRWLALIWVDGELLQQQLIVDGYSGYYTKFGCANDKLHEALLWSEAEANQKNRGVWDPKYKNQHLPVLSQWIGVDECRPNPLKGQHYCPDFEAEQQAASPTAAESLPAE